MDDLRKQIDEIDNQIMNLLQKRSDLARDIGDFKQENGLPIIDEPREQQLLDHVSKKAVELGLEPHFAKQLYKLILAESHRVQESDS